MDTQIKKILGAGLLSFSADSYKKTKRAGFDIEASDVNTPDGKYHDEWAAHQNGGGQELIETSTGAKWTRVYAGGQLDPKQLLKLGLAPKDVAEKIKFFLGKMGKVSRFDEHKNLKDDDWEYSYKVTEEIKNISLTVGKEEIKYKKTPIFIHFIVNSPVN